jgi:hypothetical protein
MASTKHFLLTHQLKKIVAVNELIGKPKQIEANLKAGQWSGIYTSPVYSLVYGDLRRQVMDVTNT